jgi:DNA modification methylase
MELDGLTKKGYFDEYKVELLVREAPFQYELFETEMQNSKIEQLEIIDTIEQKFQLLNASSFGNQVHFQNVHLIPVQRWFPYREGYSVKLVNSFIKELNIKGNVFDPFCGSGTTLLSSRLNNLDSFGMDINPISVLVSKVENENYSKEDIERLRCEINRLEHLENSNDNLRTSFNLADRVFNQEILHSLLQFRKHIEKIDSNKIRNLLFASWLSIIEKVSNIKKEGNGIKYKNRKRTPNGYVNINRENWERETFPDNKFGFVKSKLIEKLNMILNDLLKSYGSNLNIPKIFQGDCLEFDKSINNEIEFTFFSPPYCNCFDYFEIHKVELWLGNYVSSKEEFRILRSKGFRSNLNSLNHKPIVYRHRILEKLIELFDTERLWNVKIPTVIRGYFDDMYSLLHKLYMQTSKNGFVGIVVGNSAYSEVIIPTDILIADIAQELGFKVKCIFITRHLTTSSQQKQKLETLKKYLRESIIILEK